MRRGGFLAGTGLLVVGSTRLAVGKSRWRAVKESEWRQDPYAMIWVKRYVILKAKDGQHLYNAKVLHVDLWFSEDAEKWRHTAVENPLPERPKVSCRLCPATFGSLDWPNPVMALLEHRKKEHALKGGYTTPIRRTYKGVHKVTGPL